MRNLMIILGLFFCSVAVNAQDKKPTKEETISFIKRTVGLTVGMKIFGGHIVTEADFSGTTYLYKHNFTMDGSVLTKYELEFTFLNWEMVKGFNDEPRNCGQGVCELWVYFTKNIKLEKKSWGYGDKNVTTKEEYKHYLPIYIPTEKHESVKKAFLRLQEIAKEENKDPFAN